MPKIKYPKGYSLKTSAPTNFEQFALGFGLVIWLVSCAVAFASTVAGIYQGVTVVPGSGFLGTLISGVLAVMFSASMATLFNRVRKLRS